LTFSGRFLNYFSNYPIFQNKDIIFGLGDRVLLLLSDSEFYHKNFTIIVNILIVNDYPLKFIFDTINVRVKSIQYGGAVVRDCMNNSDETKNVP